MDQVFVNEGYVDTGAQIAGVTNYRAIAALPELGRYDQPPQPCLGLWTRREADSFAIIAGMIRLSEIQGDGLAEPLIQAMRAGRMNANGEDAVTYFPDIRLTR